MVQSRSAASLTQEQVGDDGNREGREALREFLLRKLPPRNAKQANYLAEALTKAGDRYDRYAAETNRRKWLNYRARRNRLQRISDLVRRLVNDLSEVDILSHEDLCSRVDAGVLQAVVASLPMIGKVAGELASETQRTGRPKDLAEERWISEAADIYENAFSEAVHTWKSESGPMSTFYHLLELSRPSSFPRYGKLSRRQIVRTLSKRSRAKTRAFVF